MIVSPSKGTHLKTPNVRHWLVNSTEPTFLASPTECTIVEGRPCRVLGPELVSNIWDVRRSFNKAYSKLLFAFADLQLES